MTATVGAATTNGAVPSNRVPLAGACTHGDGTVKQPLDAERQTGDRATRSWSMGSSDRRSLMRFMALSITGVCVTIGLKLIAWQLTGSVGLLSDALESLANLAAAVLAFAMIAWATLPPDEEHAYGHEKAEYFASGVEGGLIVATAAFITWVSIRRLVHPPEPAGMGFWLVLSAGASVVHLFVGGMLVRGGRRHRSVTLEAHGRHLLTDVLVSLGVIVGVGAVALTGWGWLDPVVAMGVAASLVLTGISLVRTSAGGLMDKALPADERAMLEPVLARYRSEGIELDVIRTRRAARVSFVSLHVGVPSSWRVSRARGLADRIEQDVRIALPHAAVSTHVEPLPSPPPPTRPIGTRALRSTHAARRRAQSVPTRRRSVSDPHVPGGRK